MNRHSAAAHDASRNAGAPRRASPRDEMRLTREGSSSPTPAGLADGLGPKSSPTLARLAPKTWVPRSRPAWRDSAMEKGYPAKVDESIATGRAHKLKNTRFRCALARMFHAKKRKAAKIAKSLALFKRRVHRGTLFPLGWLIDRQPPISSLRLRAPAWLMLFFVLLRALGGQPQLPLKPCATRKANCKRRLPTKTHEAVQLHGPRGGAKAPGTLSNSNTASAQGGCASTPRRQESPRPLRCGHPTGQWTYKQRKGRGAPWCC